MNHDDAVEEDEEDFACHDFSKKKKEKKHARKKRHGKEKMKEN